MLLLVHGVVQGVGFRPTVYRIAKSLKCKGYVRNNGSYVEICIDKDHEEFIKLLNQHLPPLANIDKIEIEKSQSHKKYNDFEIIISQNGFRTSSIPPDTALCDDCTKELLDKNDRRHLYPFTNCTNCGARFSLISDVPYDRINTSMHKFNLCKTCESEYNNPLDRRFHAQTISCPQDGPAYTLYDHSGLKIPVKEPIADFAHKLDDGALGVIKSWGGMHITCILPKLNRLRKWYNRPAKPFAIMVKDISIAEKYAIIDSHAKKLIQSPNRPIVLVRKRELNTFDDGLASTLETISPGLDNIGIYLPYTGVQHILFQELHNEALVMTSANPTGEPLIISNQEALKLNLDFYLLHNRDIINRIDDSLIIPINDKKMFIRKSRGFVPDPLRVEYKNNIISIGAERNVTSSLSRNGQLYTSQYIGNINYYDTLQFLRSGIELLIQLLGVKDIDAIAIDLHPQYPSRGLSKELAERFNADLVEIQHHWSHAASLMLDNNITEPIIALSCDGAGYGPDGTIWGGEVLYSNLDSFKRIGSLEEIPLIGGDAAVKDPRRIVFGIFERLGITDVCDNYFDEQSCEIFKKLMESSPMTTSFGRVLDALAYYLQISNSRTYDGEPAMRLEKYLDKGKPKYEFSTEIVNSERKIIRTLPLFEQLHDYCKKIELSDQTKSDLVHSFIKCIIDNFIEISTEYTEKEGVKYLGFTGGVSYNLPIMQMIDKSVLKSNFGFLTHDRIPNGDGGISVGQNVIAGNLIN
jgi:hydrogenase maturation protein HypF